MAQYSANHASRLLGCEPLDGMPLAQHSAGQCATKMRASVRAAKVRHLYTCNIPPVCMQQNRPETGTNHFTRCHGVAREVPVTLTGSDIRLLQCFLDLP